MRVICADLEGVFIPEVWVNVAIKTGIDELKLTTRDIPDYDVLMKKRLGILDKHKLTLKDIQDVIATLSPLEGAMDFINWCKERAQFVIVSDTFEEFAAPFMKQMDYPTILCHHLEVDANNRITDYVLRQEDPKRKVVQAFHNLDYKVIAFGDSYNDVTMLEEADEGILYRPPAKVIAEFSQYPVTTNYEELKEELLKHL